MMNLLKNSLYSIFRVRENKLSQAVYDSNNLLNYIKRCSLEVKEIGSDTFLDKNAFICIETNNYTLYDDAVSDNIDVFASLYKNDVANELVYYNAKNSEYIRLDERDYNQYYEGMEFTEGSLEINFPKIIDNSINKIEVGLGIYENENLSSLSLSNRHISDIVTTIRHDNVIYYSIKKNSIISESKFCIFLSFYRKDNKWYLSEEQKEYESVVEYCKINFSNTFPKGNKI